jgi:hypothetical protein
MADLFNWMYRLCPIEFSYNPACWGPFSTIVSPQVVVVNTHAMHLEVSRCTDCLHFSWSKWSLRTTSLWDAYILTCQPRTDLRFYIPLAYASYLWAKSWAQGHPSLTLSYCAAVNNGSFPRPMTTGRIAVRYQERCIGNVHRNHDVSSYMRKVVTLKAQVRSCLYAAGNL